MYCPRDQLPLSLKESEGVVGKLCHHCRGLFLEAKGVAAFRYNHQTDLLNTLDQFPTTGKSLINCPCCQNRMNRILIDAIEIDTCSSCKGIWFDADEISKILAKYSPHSKTEEKFFDGAFILEAIANLIGLLL